VKGSFSVGVKRKNKTMVMDKEKVIKGSKSKLRPNIKKCKRKKSGEFKPPVEITKSKTTMVKIAASMVRFILWG